jgi:DNA-binding GntR family transcriptional regulator
MADQGRTRLALPSVVDVVVEELRELILSGELAAGERLKEERLSERYGISRPPLREALRVLHKEGLLHREPRRGITVASFDARDVWEIYSLRAGLERLAVELALPLADPSVLDPLREQVERMQAIPLGDHAVLLDANVRFHLGLAALPAHGRLLRAYESLVGQLRLFMAMNLRVRERLLRDPLDSAHRHEKLLRLLESGDAAAVLHELRAHGEMEFVKYLDKFAGHESAPKTPPPARE